MVPLKPHIEQSMAITSLQRICAFRQQDMKQSFQADHAYAAI